jgi:isoleucyl-tRNA synthetase
MRFQKFNLPMLQPVTRGGIFTEDITDFAGQFVKDADKGIIKKLRAGRKTLKRKQLFTLILSAGGSIMFR